MRKELTDVTVVLDRSGSMQSCWIEAETGVNAFVEKQRAADGECVFSLVQFDTEYEFVHRGVPIADVPKFSLVPRGMTALLDAVGRAINETGERLKGMKKKDRPGLVVFVIVTDGAENASHEFTKAQVKELVERQQSEYQWQFTFLGANQDAFSEAKSLGIPVGAAAGYSVANTDQVFCAASSNVSRMRSAAMSGVPVAADYTDEERDSMR